MLVCGDVCSVLVVVKDSGFLSFGVLKYVVCFCKRCDVVFPLCIVTRGTVGARVWKVCVFRHTDVICLCLVCILLQFSMLYSA